LDYRGFEDGGVGSAGRLPPHSRRGARFRRRLVERFCHSNPVDLVAVDAKRLGGLEVVLPALVDDGGRAAVGAVV